MLGEVVDVLDLSQESRHYLLPSSLVSYCVIFRAICTDYRTTDYLLYRRCLTSTCIVYTRLFDGLNELLGCCGALRNPSV